MFIGLPGGSSRAVRYSDAPSGSEHLSPEIVRIYRQLDVALEMAVRRGGTAAQEDDSNGYALINDPNARSLQLEVRRWALERAGELIQVLRSSSSVGDRRIASDALGYARQSAAQMDALVQAARDPDGEVRNNATRALLVLVRSNRQLSAHISPGIFIAMLNSPVWSDRNKGAALLLELSADRNADLLENTRASAEDSLIEMASWRDTSHAYAARMILGRVAGIPEDRLRQLAWNGPVSFHPYRGQTALVRPLIRRTAKGFFAVSLLLQYGQRRSRALSAGGANHRVTSTQTLSREHCGHRNYLRRRFRAGPQTIASPEAAQYERGKHSRSAGRSSRRNASGSACQHWPRAPIGLSRAPTG